MCTKNMKFLGKKLASGNESFFAQNLAQNS